MRALIFDIETVPNVPLLKKLHPAYWGARETDTDAVKHLEFEEFYKPDGTRGMIPATMQVPVSIVVAEVGADYCIKSLHAVRDAKGFFELWEKHNEPTLVGYNSRRFDLPVLEQQALQMGASLPRWYRGAKSWEQPRNRYQIFHHWDCMDFQTNFGAGACNGGMDVQCKLIGAPGKHGCDGGSVWDMHQAGQHAEIEDYCKADVVNTYLLWLRQMLTAGRLTLYHYRAAIDSFSESLARNSRLDGEPGWASKFHAACDWTALTLANEYPLEPQQQELPQ